MAEPIGEESSTGKRLRPGEFLRDAGGGWFRVYDVGGGKLRLAPVTEDGKLLAPKSQWKSPSGAFENELGQLIQTDLTGNITTSRTIPWSDWAGGGGAGSTGSTYHPPAWRPGELELEQQALSQQSQQAAAQQQADRDRLNADIAESQANLAWAKEQFAIAEANADRRQMELFAQQIKLEEKRIENSNRELVYSEIGATGRTVLQMKEQERGRQTELAGQKPFRFAASSRGRASPMGTTPMEAFKQQGANLINFQMPQASLGMGVPQLEGVLAGLQNVQAPTSPIFGMAGGGKVGDGPFAPKQSWLIGEGKQGEGLAMGTAEVLTVEKGPFGIKSVEVTPLAGAAADGYSLGGTTNFNLGGFGPLLDALRRSRGLGGPHFYPWSQQVQGGNVTPIDVRAPLLGSEAATLGAFQKAPGTLLQSVPDFGQAPTGPVFIVDETGTLRPFTNYEVFRQSGFTPAQVEFMPAHQLERFRVGEAITNQPFTMPPANYQSAFGAAGQPLSTLGGFQDLARFGAISPGEAANRANAVGFLPAPHKFAQDYRLMRPEEQSFIQDAYSFAGYSPEGFQSAMSAATPTGRMFKPQRIGFTGTRL